jgi:transcriptional regulator with XRE-family HTH domain
MKKRTKTAEDYIPLSSELRSKRLLMGLKALQFCKAHGFNQGNYSKMERGFADPSKPLEKMQVIFASWKKQRLQELKTEIRNLEKIS